MPKEPAAPKQKDEEDQKWDIERAIKSRAPRSANAIKSDCKFIKKTPPTTIAEVEKNLWKNNISYAKRTPKDFLDIADEDFRQHTQKSIIENENLSPSTFNIFRDSLKKTS